MSLTNFIPKVTSLECVQELKQRIIRFDEDWVAYEKAYVGELIVIEHDARRFIRNLTAGSFDTPAIFC